MLRTSVYCRCQSEKKKRLEKCFVGNLQYGTRLVGAVFSVSTFKSNCHSYNCRGIHVTLPLQVHTALVRTSLLQSLKETTTVQVLVRESGYL